MSLLLIYIWISFNRSRQVDRSEKNNVRFDRLRQCWSQVRIVEEDVRLPGATSPPVLCSQKLPPLIILLFIGAFK